MKKLILPGLTAAILFMASPQEHLNAQTPIIQTKFTADPAPMVHKGTVYLYTTHDEDYAPEGMAGFRMKEWLLYTSTDMVNWTDHGTIANLYNFKWADPAVSGWGGFENGAWAPQCIERNGKFYLYCPVQGRGIGVLVADNPFGPFTDPLGKPLIGAEYDSIDPSVLIDDDGQAYLYWGNPNLWYVKLNEDMISCAGEITKDKLIRKIENQKDPYHFQEGPWAYKKNGHYYMAYASTCCPEGIGYAMGPGPVGPWEFKGYIMKPNGKSSGNHPGIIDYKGKSYVFGFNYRLNFMITDKHHERRSICVAELEYNPDGTIKELPWWDDGVGVEPVGTLNPYKRTEAETMAWSQGLKTAKDDKSGMYVTSIHNRDFLQVKAVDFGKGAKTFEVRAATITKGKIEIRLDDLDGTLLGVCDISNTGGWNMWKTFVTDVEKVGGVHDLYLVFRGGDGEMFNMDYWRFK
ncbi:glycoside hydrolase family 43 protein [Bacteroides oleiciplenus]|uniref:glycoside hydrolase family 43 protein n=1 Tax=Bacteroides oleiciplenus TaxID=626931 RepID=UPI0026DBBB54|nr:glycoside hydrolase family 43 protein [Bacteroides oleiciplenus]